MESQMTRPYGHDQAEDPIRIHHPEEEEHQEKGTSKVLKKVKEKAKKIKNSLTKHGQGHEHDHDVDKEDDEYDEPDPEAHGAPVYESSALRGGVTGQPESLSHPGKTNVPAPEDIIPPGTKVFPVVSSDYTKPIEAEPLRDTSYGHEALSDPVRTTDTSDREERREAPTRPFKVSDLSDRGEKVSDESHDQKSGLGFGSDLPTIRSEFKRESESGIGEDSPARFGGDPEAELGKHSPTRSHEFDQKTESAIDKNSLAGFDIKSGAVLGKEFPTRSHEFDHKTESGAGKDSSSGFRAASGAELGKDFPTKSHEFGQRAESETNKNSPTGLGSGSIAGLTEDFPARSHELGLKTDSEIGKDSPTRSHGYGDESGPGQKKNLLPARNDNVEVKTVSERDLPTGTHDQFSPELSRPKERDDFGSKAEETKDETHEPKPSTYTDKIASATSVITDKALAAKNALASKLGYSGESRQHESPVVRDETPRSATGYGQKVVGTVAELLSPVYEKAKATGSTVMTKLPLSGGGTGAEETQKGEDKSVPARGYLAEKLRPGEEDKALSEMIAEKLHLGGGGEKKKTTTKEEEVTVEKIPSDQVPKELEHGATVVEEGKGGGGGMVGKIKGWFGGAPGEAKPKSSDSVEESPQSLGSTVGTMGLSDSGGGGAVPRGHQESGN